MSGILDYNYTIIVTITCRNEFNAESNSSTNIRIKPQKEHQTVIWVKGFIDDISIYNNHNNIEYLLELFKLSSVVILPNNSHKYNDLCGGCNIPHGYCSQETRKCICDEGYEYAPDCSIQNISALEYVENTYKIAYSLYNVTEKWDNQESLYGQKELAYSMLYTLNTLTLNQQINLTSTNLLVANMLKNFTDYLNIKYNQKSLSIVYGDEMLNLGFKILDNLGIGYENLYNIDNNITNILNGQLELAHMLKQMGKSKIHNFQITPKILEVHKKTYEWVGGKISNYLFEDSKYEIVIPKVEDNHTQVGIVNWKLNPLKGHPMSEYQISNTIEISIYQGDANIHNFSHIYIKFPFVVKVGANIEPYVHCLYFNETIREYSNKGLLIHSIEYENSTGVGYIQCKSSHLSFFTVVMSNTYLLAKEIGYIMTDNNLMKVPEKDEIQTHNPLYSFGILYI